MGVVTNVLLQDYLALGIDGDVVKHLLAFSAVEQQLDGAARGQVAGVREVRSPQPARLVEAVGRHKVEAVGIDRVPHAVFRTQERGYAGRFAGGVDLSAGHAADVAEIDHRERRLFVRAKREAALDSLLANPSRSVTWIRTDRRRSVCLFHGVAGRLLVTGVEVDLAVLAVVQPRDHRPVAGVRVSYDILEERLPSHANS